MNRDKEFVPYEQALELKELGFDEPCFAFYNGKFIQSTEFDFDSYNSINVGPHPLAPTFSQAFRWFREKYDIPCNLELLEGGWDYVIYMDIGIEEEIDLGEGPFITYEEAELACLIKLIEIAKENKQ